MSDINLNMAQCLRDVSYFGYTRIFNACTGAHYDLPWGFWAWLGIILAVAVPSLLLAFFVWLNFPIWQMEREYKSRRVAR